MIVGRFGDTTGVVYVEGEIDFPRLNVRAALSFLVDTGADLTTIMPSDGELALGLDYSQLKGSFPTVGFGGNSNCFVESAIIAFTEPGVRVRFYLTEVLIARYNPDLLILPSVLGRDILSQWDIRVAPGRDPPLLEIEVVTADLTVPLRP